MVLSRKKLKEKLRSLLAESQSKNSATDGREEIVKVLESVREMLRESKSKRPRPSRPKRKKKPPLNGEEGKEEKNEGETEEKEDEACQLEKGSREKKAVKTEKMKKEKKKNKKKNRKAEASKEEKQSEMNEAALETTNGQNESISEQKAIESTPSIKPYANGQNESISEPKAIESNPSIKLADIEDNAKKVYVGGIPYYSTEDDIKSFFEGCGTVTDVDCMKFPETGKFRGIAILTFKDNFCYQYLAKQLLYYLQTQSAAKRATSLDGSDMGGFYLKIQPYKGKRAKKPDFCPQTIEGYNRIYIGNLSWDITEDDLKNLFKNCKILSIRFGTDKSTGDFKGFAHVDFEEGDSLAIALKLDQEVVHGRPVRIRCAVPRRVSETVNDSVKKASNDNDVITEEEKGEKIGEEVEVHKKQKRRTCYECGTPGHLSSACPNKKTNADSNNGTKQEEVNKMREEEVMDTTQEGSVHKKQKRCTCYECGTPGHLSSACPNKKSFVDGNDIILHQEIQQEDSNKIREEQVVDTLGDSVRKKKKRRTCYECGIPGHLSSECPNKAS